MSRALGSRSLHLRQFKHRIWILVKVSGLILSEQLTPISLKNLSGSAAADEWVPEIIMKND
jgi:hypothetical protein